MNYWNTTHWPPRHTDKNTDHTGIYLVDGSQSVGEDLRAGDQVLVYELKSGPTIQLEAGQGKMPHLRRRGGILTLAKVTTSLHEREGSHVEKCVDRESLNWRWMADTRCIDSDGFVGRRLVNLALGYAENYSFRGFGDRRSGLKRLSPGLFHALYCEFKNHPRVLPAAL